MRRSRIFREVMNYVMAFILMLSLMCISLLAVGKYSMLSYHGVMHTCERIEYYDSVRKEIRKLARYMGTPYGIEKDSLKGVFKNEKIESDMGQVLKAQIDGEEYTIDTEEIREALYENVQEQFGGELTDEQQESMDAYISEVEDMYVSKMVIPGSSYIVDFINLSDRVVLVGIPACVLIAIICCFLLISTRRYKYHGLRFIAYGLLGAGITLLTVFAGEISDGAIYRINISDVYMRKFYTYIVGHEMLMQAFVGIGLLIAGGVVVYMVIRDKNRELSEI